MLDFHYNTIKRQYGNKATLLFTDTDSLCYEVQTDDVYEDMKQSKTLYDFSEYPEEHPLYDVSNKKRAGKFKDEMSGTSLIECLVQSQKVYSHKCSGFSDDQ